VEFVTTLVKKREGERESFLFTSNWESKKIGRKKREKGQRKESLPTTQKEKGGGQN